VLGSRQKIRAIRGSRGETRAMLEPRNGSAAVRDKSDAGHEKRVRIGAYLLGESGSSAPSAPHPREYLAGIPREGPSPFLTKTSRAARGDLCRCRRK
jgi:hypothetical protein